MKQRFYDAIPPSEDALLQLA